MSERSAESQVVIVGAGLAGVQTALQLREQGWTGSVRLVGAEPHPPYDRPPLSKAVLSGKADSAAFDVDLTQLDVHLELDRRVTGLRPAEHLLETAEGPIPYDHLVIATGAEPVTLPGSAHLPGVHLLRTLDDALRLRPVLARRRSLVVVGAGWIGAECATAAREAGADVTVVEAAEQPLAGALPPEVAAPMARWYRQWGVELRTGQPVASVAEGEVRLADGTGLPAAAVVVGIGARPATGWLAGSGVALAADGSVRADARLRASVPDVYAVGDCASFPSARYGERLLVHHWDNAMRGPRVVAANILADTQPDGDAEGLVHDPVPYFWSEQFGRFVQYAGHHPAGDTLVWRGDPTQDAWTTLWLRGETLVALLAVGRPRDLTQGRRLIERGAALDPRRAADPTVPLRTAVRPG